MTETRPERKLREVTIGADHKPINELFNFICPDCGCKIDKPTYNRNVIFSDGQRMASEVYIECPICGFRTNNHLTVRLCYDEWNECEL